ncbi:hypothetical protein [Pseudomonas monsensis]|nr:hypothetical protein [Pseudomonas monsensis]
MKGLAGRMTRYRNKREGRLGILWESHTPPSELQLIRGTPQRGHLTGTSRFTDDIENITGCGFLSTLEGDLRNSAHAYAKSKMTIINLCLFWPTPYTDFINPPIKALRIDIRNCHFYQVTKKRHQLNLINVIRKKIHFGLTCSPNLKYRERMVNIMPTYQGTVSDTGESNCATLTFDEPSQQNGQLNNGKMQYYGLNFTVTGSYTAKNSRSFNLQAKAKASDGDEYGHGDSSLTISLKSADANDNKLSGTVKVVSGGPNVGKTYNMNFTKG